MEQTDSHKVEKRVNTAWVESRELNKRAILPMWLPNCLKELSTHLHTHLQGFTSWRPSSSLQPLGLAVSHTTSSLVSHGVTPFSCPFLWISLILNSLKVLPVPLQKALPVLMQRKRTGLHVSNADSPCKPTKVNCHEQT